MARLAPEARFQGRSQGWVTPVRQTITAGEVFGNPGNTVPGPKPNVPSSKLRRLRAGTTREPRRDAARGRGTPQLRTSQRRVEDGPDQALVGPPRQAGEDHQVARLGVQARQRIDLQEIWHAVAQAEVDARDVPAAQGAIRLPG